MFDAIIAFSLRKKALVILLTILLVIGGIYAFTLLPIDAVPDITNNQVQVLTSAPALSPFEVEHYVTAPLEADLKSLPDLIELRSLSRPGLSVITLVFKDNVDIYFARQLVHERISDAESNLPSTAQKPELAPVSTGLGEIFRYVVRDTTGKLSPMDLRTVQDWIIRKQLQGIPGLAEVNSLGGLVKQVHVLVDPDALIKYGLTLHEVFEAVNKSSGSAGGGYIESGQEQYTIRSAGQAASVSDIQHSVIKATPTGTPILISDVASVELGSALRFGSASQAGRGEVVTGITMQLKGANSRITVRSVKDKIEEIKTSLPPGVVIEPYYDRETLVNRTLRTVVQNLVEGALLVIVVLLLFLANLRAGMILASVIPLTMLLTAILMVLTGQSGNLMSLGAIDFGLVVDGALFIVENCLRLLVLGKKDNPGGLQKAGMNALISSGSMEVLQSAKFGVFIIIIVFLPIATLQGIEGKLFRPMAITVIFALISALLLTVTYVPVMCSMFLKRDGNIRESPIMHVLERYYHPLLEGSFRKRKMILTGILALFAGAIWLFSTLGGEFIPRLDEGDISISLIRLPSISLTESQKLATQVEAELMKFPEVKTVVSHTGRAEISTDPMGFELSDVFVILTPREEWKSKRSKDELIHAMTASLADIPGIGTQFLQPIEMRMNELIAGVKGDVAIKIFGEDFGVLNPAAESVAKILRATRGATDVSVEQTTGLPQLIIQPNRTEMARYGVSVEDLNFMVTTAISGQQAGQIYEGEKRFDIVVKYQPQSRNTPEAIGRIQVVTPSGAHVPLGQLAHLSQEDAAAQVSRENGSRFISVQANVRERDVKSFVTEVQARVNRQLKLPPGYFIEYGGQFKNLQAASQRLMIVVPLALFLIFFLLYEAFASFRPALLIFLCVPLAIIGAVVSLAIAGLPFSISSGVGFIALFGIAVLNGIVMVAAIRKYQAEGLSVHDAIMAGSRQRLRPVVTTAALAGFGFLPMLLARGAGAEVQRPLATVVVGGLISSTLLTLFVLPLLYEWLIMSKTRNMKQNRNTKLWKRSAFVIAMCATATIVGCNNQPQGAERVVEPTAKTEKAVIITLGALAQMNAGIEVGAVTADGMNQSISAPARITPTQSGVAHVGSFIPGRVTKLLVQEGSAVSKNQILAELASYDLSELISENLKAHTEVVLTKGVLARQSRLSNDKLLSEQELEEAQSNHAQAIARLHSAQSKLRTLGLDPEKLAEDNAEGLRSTIALRSPIAGIVSKRLVEIGDFVQPDSNLFEVIDLRTVWADAQVSPQVASTLNVGSTGSVQSPDGSSASGKVIFISPTADPVSHTMTVRLELDNVSHDLKPETFVTALFESKNAAAGGLTIPLQALEKEGDEYYVYKRLSDTSFQRIHVTVHSKNERQASVASPELSEGDRVVIAGTFYLKSALKQDELQDRE